MGPTMATRAYPKAPLPTPADIYDKVSGELQKNGYDCECLGGGRISHQSQDRKIHVYGYSMVSSGPQSLGQTDLVSATPRLATQTTSGTHKVEATEPFKAVTSSPHISHMTSGWLEATCLGLYSLIVEPSGSVSWLFGGGEAWASQSWGQTQSPGHLHLSIKTTLKPQASPTQPIQFPARLGW